MWKESRLRQASGYFANQRNRRGRQLGRVLASGYGEIVVDRLFGGTIQLTKALRPLMQAAEQTLQLDRAKRCRTLVRVDAGGGSLADVNWLLRRGRPGSSAKIIPVLAPGAWRRASRPGWRIRRCKGVRWAG